MGIESWFKPKQKVIVEGMKNDVESDGVGHMILGAGAAAVLVAHGVHDMHHSKDVAHAPGETVPAVAPGSPENPTLGMHVDDAPKPVIVEHSEK